MAWLIALLAVILLAIFSQSFQRFALAFLVLITVGLGSMFAYQQYQRAQANSVSILVQHTSNDCSPGEPLKVVLRNGSNQQVDLISWKIAAYRRGFSSNMSKDPSVRYSSDKIMAPGEETVLCYALPTLTQYVKPDELFFEAADMQVTFSNKSF